MLYFPLSCYSELSTSLFLCLQGQSFFLETTFSSTKNVSCSTCHNPQTHFTDLRPMPIVRQILVGTQKTPKLFDLEEGPFFYNGRAQTLAQQAFWPLYHKLEIDASPQSLADFGGAHYITNTLQVFLQTIKSPKSKIDLISEGSVSFTQKEKNGMQLFNDHCLQCHSSKAFRGGKLWTLRYKKTTHVNFNQDFKQKETTYLADTIDEKENWLEIKSLPTGLRDFKSLIYFGRYSEKTSFQTFLPYHLWQTSNYQKKSAYSEKETEDLELFLKTL